MGDYDVQAVSYTHLDVYKRQVLGPRPLMSIESILTRTGWNRRSKEEAHDYRYFPEPDLAPIIIDDAWIEKAKSELPELRCV